MSRTARRKIPLSRLHRNGLRQSRPPVGAAANHHRRKGKGCMALCSGQDKSLRFVLRRSAWAQLPPCVVLWPAPCKVLTSYERFSEANPGAVLQVRRPNLKAERFSAMEADKNTSSRSDSDLELRAPDDPASRRLDLHCAQSREHFPLQHRCHLPKLRGPRTRVLESCVGVKERRLNSGNLSQGDS
jgi:predicted component of type VI protein secretion system